ncbi:MAG: DUF4860 domain-containing protein [Lachnospiraceae bacterium]|nr:DUF4860 domain-containing protein [Lachnospiraceae bacterium]
MRFHQQRKHMIDLMFPIALFFVFAVSAVAVILMATGIYRSIITSSAMNNTSRTCLNYVAEKIHQNDTARGVSLGRLGDSDCLILTHSGDRTGYVTYIYAHQGELRELLADADLSVTPDMGKTIMAVADFTMEETDRGLLRLSCTDAHGLRVSTLVGVRSRQEDL